MDVEHTCRLGGMNATHYCSEGDDDHSHSRCDRSAFDMCRAAVDELTELVNRSRLISHLHKPNTTHNTSGTEHHMHNMTGPMMNMTVLHNMSIDELGEICLVRHPGLQMRGGSDAPQEMPNAPKGTPELPCKEHMHCEHRALDACREVGHKMEEELHFLESGALLWGPGAVQGECDKMAKFHCDMARLNMTMGLGLFSDDVPLAARIYRARLSAKVMRGGSGIDKFYVRNYGHALLLHEGRRRPPWAGSASVMTEEMCQAVTGYYSCLERTQCCEQFGWPPMEAGEMEDAVKVCENFGFHVPHCEQVSHCPCESGKLGNKICVVTTTATVQAQALVAMAAGTDVCCLLSEDRPEAAVETWPRAFPQGPSEPGHFERLIPTSPSQRADMIVHDASIQDTAIGGAEYSVFSPVLRPARTPRTPPCWTCPGNLFPIKALLYDSNFLTGKEVVCVTVPQAARRHSGRRIQLLLRTQPDCAHYAKSFGAFAFTTEMNGPHCAPGDMQCSIYTDDVVIFNASIGECGRFALANKSCTQYTEQGTFYIKYSLLPMILPAIAGNLEDLGEEERAFWGGSVGSGSWSRVYSELARVVAADSLDMTDPRLFVSIFQVGYDSSSADQVNGQEVRRQCCLDQNRDICGPFGQKLAVEVGPDGSVDVTSPFASLIAVGLATKAGERGGKPFLELVMQLALCLAQANAGAMSRLDVVPSFGPFTSDSGTDDHGQCNEEKADACVPPELENLSPDVGLLDRGSLQEGRRWDQFRASAGCAACLSKVCSDPSPQLKGRGRARPVGYW
ncbi:hypothetical protein AK812_SmicGene24511 [Symbiodinium microadriaticum]|uniref:Uncharacterized protein n=1 Tax=Symbiodinium microadriaticum TaxID=2951 RepID=A0A1Q9DEJ0_SYMMI|nr:hypothetical protein AK812_SmicGene24511 [Symbiodinium microadriaticum]